MDRTVELLTSYDDVLMTWTKVDIDVLAWQLTWSDDVNSVTSSAPRHLADH